MTLDDYVGSIKLAVKEASTKATVSAIIAAAPYLAPFSMVINFIVGKVIEYMIYQTEMATFFLYIDIRTAKQGNEFERAAIDNYLIQKSTTATKEEKMRAKENAIIAFRNFVKFSR